MADTSRPGSLLPLEFEQNRGQADKSVLFLARGASGAAYLTRPAAVFQAGANEVRMTLAGSNSSPVVRGENPLPGVSNYLLGNDRKKWIRGAPHWARVRYAQVYPGIDLLYRGGQQSLEYDFLVAPGADPSAIRLQFDRSAALHLEENGDLLICAPRCEIRQHRPVVYQQKDGKRQLVAGAYRLDSRTGNKSVRFVLGAYDRRLALVIDPVLTYGTVLAGNGSATPFALAVDSPGSAYMGGLAQSLNFPTVNSQRAPSTGTGLYFSRDAAGTFTRFAAPPPGQVEALAADPRNPSILYAATLKGVFKTTDAGQSWSLLSGGLPVNQYFSLAIDPNNSAVVYAGGTGFYKSTDAGATWTLLIEIGAVSIAIDPENSSVVWFVPSFGPVVRTADGGKTFAGFGVQNVNYSVTVDPTNSSKVYVGRGGIGLYTTSDGANFSARTTDFSPMART
jgi:hypothetical protein